MWIRRDLQGSLSPTPVIFVCFLNEKDVWMRALVLCSSSVSNTQGEWAPRKKPFLSSATQCLKKIASKHYIQAKSEQKLRCLWTAFTWCESRQLPIGFSAALLINLSQVLTNEQKPIFLEIVFWSPTLKIQEIQTVLVCGKNLRSPQHEVCFKNERINDSFCILKSKNTLNKIQECVLLNASILQYNKWYRTYL